MRKELDYSLVLPPGKERQYTIDKAVPIPRKIGFLYPFGEMEVGDSFFHEDIRDNNVSRRLSNAAKEYGKTHDKRFTTRRVPGGYRVWRIK